MALLAAGTALALSPVGAGHEPASRKPPVPLFVATASLELELETDLRALWARSRDDAPQPGILRWHHDGKGGEVSVGVSPRGRFRRDRENCRFPPLFLELPGITGGPFAGQSVLPLGTHCQKGHAQYVVQEYLIYRMLTLLTDDSVAVRLARTRYVDSSGRSRPFESFSIVMEHFDAMAARVGGAMVDDRRLRPSDFQPRAAALVDVFQYLIGNTDWSTLEQHNIALLRTATGDLVPVPYDFDFAGVIDARYAVPSETLDIRSVRQRVYRGFCRQDEIVLEAIGRIKSRRSEIYALYRETPELEPKLLERSLRYYDEFFELLDSPEALHREILGACRSVGESLRTSVP